MRLPRVRRISTRVLISFILVVIFQGALSIVTLYLMMTQATESSIEDQRLRTRSFIERYFADVLKQVQVNADLLSGQAKFAGFIARGDTYSLKRELEFYLTPLKIDSIFVCDESGAPITIAGDRDMASVHLRRNPWDEYLLGNAVTISGEGNKIQIWGINPISLGDRKALLGAAFSLNRSFIGRIEEITGTVMLLALRKSILVNGRLSDDKFIEYSRRVSRDPEAGSSGMIGNYVYKTAILRGLPELEMVYFIDRGPGVELLGRYVTGALILLAIALVVAFLISMLLYRFSFHKPFTEFLAVIRQISKGDLNFQPTLEGAVEFVELEREFGDMTANLRNLERKLQISSRMAAIGEMVAGVAHQIRNPLAIMRVSAEMIRDKATQSMGGHADDAKIASLGAMIVSEVDSLSTIVSKFLDFTKPLSIKKSPTDVAALVRRVVDHLPAEARNGVKVSVRCSPGAGVVRLDEHLIEQALGNLANNAIEACQGSGEISITADRSDGSLRLSVEDTGPGLPEDTATQIFNPFYTTKSDGTGLGLSIVHRIMEAHGGTVEAMNKPEGGAVFTLTIKADDIDG
jgi:signal transduction histidine kinase